MSQHQHLSGFKIKAMFALEFASIGCFFPIFSVYLKDELQFDGLQIGWMQSCGAVSALVSPILGAVVLHRWLSPKAVLSIAHLMAAITITFFIHLVDFSILLPIYFLYQICFSPSIGLCNSIAFANLGEEKRQHFGEYRLWGTVSWILVSWFGALWLKSPWGELTHLFYISCLSSLSLSLLALSFPKQMKDKPPEGWRNFFPKDAAKVFLSWPILRWSIFAFFMGCIYQYHFIGVSPHLKTFGLSESNILILMTSAQVAEIFLMYKLRSIIEKLGLKNTLLLGTFTVIIEFAILALYLPFPWLIFALISHGVTFSFLSTPFVMIIDQQVPPKLRAGIHQLMGLLSPGLSSLVGGLFAGTMMKLNFENNMAFWSTPLMIGALLAVAIFFLKGLPANLSNPTTAKAS